MKKQQYIDVQSLRRDKRRRLVHSLYFLVQYFVIRTVLFGLVLQPSIVQYYEVFNFAGITLAALDFYYLVPMAANVGHWLLLVFYLVPFVIRLLWEARALLLFCFVLLQLITDLAYRIKVWRSAQEVTTNNQVTILNGAPGTGKTRKTVYEVLTLANMLWLRLQYEYWRDLPKVPKWIAAGNETRLKDWQDTEESYLYYTTPQVTSDGEQRLPLPCLFSNIGIMANGKYSSRLDYGHLSGAKRTPKYTIKFCDEIGAVLELQDETTGYKKLLDVSDNGRFVRQINENYIYGCEQDSTNINKEVRRIVSRNDYMQECRPVLRPWLLLLPFNALRWFFATYQVGRCRPLSWLMSAFESFLGCIGFVRFVYRPEGNTEHMQEYQSDRPFYMPAIGNGHYDTRAYRFLTDNLERPVTGRVHRQLHIEPTAVNKDAFLRSFDLLSDDDILKLEDQFWDYEAFLANLEKLRHKYPDKYDRIRLKLAEYTKDRRKTP